ncbi:MAG: MmgE/PrpD family protein [Candidatus Thermoplasmatota archaeon]|jgi:2-methylcitrate dehydratase|nr:MmgE/PrpD family protein [Cuniculiplasma sp.]MCL4320749.1 MmgE/PrpD family protein [Candidatus Thermoplasmatota archaeon]MCL6014277.1 MmgE/PrpD family protein [Candidatus Thermoplasmatota archaeon]
MDKIVSEIWNMAQGKSAPSGPSEMDELKKRVADIAFTSYGALKAEPVKIMKKSLLPSSGKKNATIFFTRDRASVEIATMINGTTTRYLDFNDTYLSKEALHPSDNIPPLIAMAESEELDGKKVLDAARVSYETVCALSDAVSIRDRGWDHVTYISISSGAGLAHLLDLSEERFAHTINLALNNNISMRQTRAGELSMWKGATAANACRNSVFAANLAQEGFTGPAPIFEGEMGFIKQVSGNLNMDFSKSRILKTMIKNYPVEYHAMSAAEVASNLRKKMKGKIRKVEVETFTVAHTIIIKDPEKLRPKTRETADHSMPYIIALTLVKGDPTPQSYENDLLMDKEILSVIDKMKFKITDRFDKMYPEFLPVKIKVETDEGVFEEEMDAPKGHNKKPYTWDDLKKKGTRVMSEDSSSSIIEFARSFENRSMKEFMEVLRNVKA